VAPSALELRAAPDALLDEPLVASVRGLGGGGAAGEPLPSLLWRARLRDDDGRVWRSAAETPAGLAAAWEPAKGSTGGAAALQSLRPMTLELRAEASDGRSASRALTRRALANGVRARRWREGVRGTLFLPADVPTAAAVVVVDRPALPAAALLASRGVLLFAVGDERDLARATELLAHVPAAAAAGTVRRLDAPLPLPPGLPARAAPDAHSWDALLAALGARPRAGG
jgi:hypothetical protein